MLEREARARPDLALVAGRELDREAGADQAARARLEDERVRGDQVEPGGPSVW